MFLDLTDKGGFYVSGALGDTDENGVSTTFTVRLSSAPNSGDNDSTDNVTVRMFSSDPGEGVIGSLIGGGGNHDNASQLVFTSSDWNVPRTVTVTGVADNLSDGDQSFRIVLQADNKTADTRFRDVDPADVVLTNLDLTDKGRFYVSEIKGDTDENGVASYFTVRLSSAPDDGKPGEDNVTITMASSRRRSDLFFDRKSTDRRQRLTTGIHFIELERGAYGDSGRSAGQLQ